MFEWPWIVAFVVPCYFLQTLIHEASHAIAALLHGLEVTSFKIWPHTVTTGNDTERFYWGRVTYRSKSDYVYDRKEAGIRAWAPFIVGLPLWLICLGSEWISSPSGIAWTFFYVYWGALTTDLARGLLQPTWREERGDANRGARAFDLPRWLLVPVGVLLSATLAGVYAWRVSKAL